MPTSKFLILFFILLYVAFSCKEDDPEPLSSKGVLRGQLVVHDEERTDITIKLSGPYGDKKITIDSDTFDLYDNNFFLRDLSNGNYVLTISKEGCNTIENVNVRSFGIDTSYIGLFNLFPVFLNFQRPNIVLHHQDQENVYFSSTIEGSNLRIFFSSRNDVSYKKYQDCESLSIYGQNSERISKSHLAFKKGSKIYAIAYHAIGNDQGYFNMYGYRIYSSINPEIHSDVISFTLE